MSAGEQLNEKGIRDFDGKKMVPDDFIDGVTSYVHHNHKPGIDFTKRQPSTVEETKRFSFGQNWVKIPTLSCLCDLR